MLKNFTVKCNACDKWFITLTGFRKHWLGKHKNLPVEYSYALGPEDALTNDKLRSGSASSSEDSEAEASHRAFSVSGEELVDGLANLLFGINLEDADPFNANRNPVDPEEMDVDNPSALEHRNFSESQSPPNVRQHSCNPPAPEAPNSTTHAHTEPPSSYIRRYHPRINGEYI